MRQRLSPGTARAVALGVLALLVISVIAIAAGPYYLAVTRQQQAERTGQQIELLERQLVERENLLAEKRMLERGGEQQSLSIEAETPGLGGAALQSIVTAIVEDNGGLLSSTQIIEPQRSEGFVELRIRVAFETDIEHLRMILHGIETYVPTLIIRALNIASPKPGLASDSQDHLQISLSIAGFMRAPAAESADTG